jgi:prevent-host-death family protein
MSESILSISDFKADASRLLDQMRDEPSRIVLTQNGRARAVVEDYAAYRRREQALLMLKLMAQGEADARQGRLTDQTEVFGAVRERLRDSSPWIRWRCAGGARSTERKRGRVVPLSAIDVFQYGADRA